MEPQLQREFLELRSNTCHLLRQRRHILRSKHRPLLQYLVMPSFTNAWCIDIVRSGEALAAYCTTWRMQTDYEAFATATERLRHPRPYVPTLESVSLHVPSDAIESLYSRLGRIRLPLTTVPDTMSLDGTSYELQIGDGLTGVLLQWHNHLPDEWPAELHAIVSELHAMEALHDPISIDTINR